MTNMVRRRMGQLLRRSRPRFWLYLAGPVLVGLVYGIDAGRVEVVELVIFVGYFLIPANVLLYGLNDVFDAELDAINPKKGNRELEWHHDRVAVTGIGLAGLLGVLPILVSPPAAWPYLLGFFFLAITYSAPPIRWKTVPLFDSISNGLYILPGAAAFVTVSGFHPPLLAIAGAWCWTMGMHTFSALPDITPDRAAGIRTTATVLGPRRTYVYCFACWGGAAVLLGLVDYRAGILLGLYPVIGAGIWASSVSIERAYWWFPWINGLVGTILTIAGLGTLLPIEVLG